MGIGIIAVGKFAEYSPIRFMIFGESKRVQGGYFHCREGLTAGIRSKMPSLNLTLTTKFLSLQTFGLGHHLTGKPYPRKKILILRWLS